MRITYMSRLNPCSALDNMEKFKTFIPGHHFTGLMCLTAMPGGWVSYMNGKGIIKDDPNIELWINYTSWGGVQHPVLGFIVGGFDLYHLSKIELRRELHYLAKGFKGARDYKKKIDLYLKEAGEKWDNYYKKGRERLRKK